MDTYFIWNNTTTFTNVSYFGQYVYSHIAHIHRIFLCVIREPLSFLTLSCHTVSSLPPSLVTYRWSSRARVPLLQCCYTHSCCMILKPLSQLEEKRKRIHPSSFTPSSSSSRLLEGLSSWCAGALCFSHHALLTRAALASGEELIKSLTMATGCSPKHTSCEWFCLDQAGLQSARCGSHLRERLWSPSRSLARGWGSSDFQWCHPPPANHLRVRRFDWINLELALSCEPSAVCSRKL